MEKQLPPGTAVGSLGHDTDVLVVGAGPTGLAAANVLAQAGVSVEVLERDAGPIEESRAILVAQRTQELFDKLGLIGDALDRGEILDGAHVMVDGRVRRTLDLALSDDESPYPRPLVLEQSRTQRMLLAGLRSHDCDVRWATAVERVAQDDRGVTVTATDAGGATVRRTARYVIGADGARSVVRDQIGIDFAGDTYPAGFFLADVDMVWAHDRDHMAINVTEAGIAGFFPMDGGANRYRLLGTLPGERADRDDLDLDDVRAHMADMGVEVELSDPRWISTYRIHKRRAERFRDRRVFLAGDAAHIHSPAGGQGMNLSIGDGVNLAWKLAAAVRGEAGERLLASYEAERIGSAEHILRLSDRVMDLETASGPAMRFARRYVTAVAAALVARSPRLLRFASRMLSQLAIAYPDSPAVTSADGARRVVAGERAPRADVTVDGTPVTTFDVIRGVDHHLLVFEGTSRATNLDHVVAALHEVTARAAPTIHTTVVSATDRAAHHAYAAARPTAVLVRPDGYIGYRGSARDTGALRTYLDRLYGARVRVAA